MATPGIQGASASPAGQQPSAKVAITAFCSALQLAGLPVPLASEAVRLAKFAQGEADALWLALHDLVILRLGSCGGEGGTASSGGALSRLWADVQAEEAEETPPDVNNGLQVNQAGRDMVVQQLATWGCPAALVNHLIYPPPPDATAVDSGAPHHLQAASTRHLLLALVWLAAQPPSVVTLALQQIASPPDTLLLLPPLAEDTRLVGAATQAYLSAARDASARASAIVSHVAAATQRACQLAAPAGAHEGSQRLGTSHAHQPQHGQQGHSAGSASRPAGLPAGGGAEAEAAAWRVADAAAHSALSVLGRMRGALLSLQSQADSIARLSAEVWALQASAWPGRRSAASALSPTEVALAQQQPLQQQHAQALASVAAVLQQQLQLLSGTLLFFKWAGSVLAEEERMRPLATGAAAGPRGEGTPAVSQSPYLQQPPQQQRQPPGTLQAPTQGSATLATLAALPDAGGPAAAALVQQLLAQVTALAAPTAPALSDAAAANPSRRAGGPPAPQHITAEHFRQLARAAIPLPDPDPTSSSSVSPLPPGPPGGRPGSQWLGGSGEGAGAAAGWPELPGDVREMLGVRRQAEAEAQWRRRKWLSRQLLQQLGSCCVSQRLVGADTADSAGRPGEAAGGAGSLQDEVARLTELTLAVARSLAHVRGAHRQALRAAGDALRDAGMVVVGI